MDQVYRKPPMPSTRVCFNIGGRHVHLPDSNGPPGFILPLSPFVQMVGEHGIAGWHPFALLASLVG